MKVIRERHMGRDCLKWIGFREDLFSRGLIFAWADSGQTLEVR